MNRQGRQTRPNETRGSDNPQATFTGHQALDHEEALIFELGRDGQCGVDLPEPDVPMIATYSPF